MNVIAGLVPDYARIDLSVDLTTVPIVDIQGIAIDRAATVIQGLSPLHGQGCACSED